MDPQSSKRKTYILILFTLGNFLSGTTMSILAPFYPAEAEKKGASATEYGMVFSVFELISFICAPLFGKYLYKIGPRLALNTGILAQAIASTLFGVLDNCDGRAWFISLSILIRITEAIGSTSYVTASYVLIAMEFPDSMAKTFAALETAFGLALLAGPPIGGILFEMGGYPLPFLVNGGFFIVVACLSPVLTSTPSVRNSSSDPAFEIKNSLKSGSGIFQLLKVPGAALAALNVMSCSITNSFVSTILEPHIREFHLTPVQVTGIFVALLGTYAVSAPLWGWICDKIFETNYVSLAGLIFMITGCMLIGPAPFLPFKTLIWVISIGCALQGFGTGALYVSSFLQMADWATKSGFRDDVTTYGLTSGIWYSMLSFGCFIGPITSGILYDNVGFRMGSLLCIVQHLIMIIVQVSFILWIRKRPFSTVIENQNVTPQMFALEEQPLLNTDSE